MLCWRRRNNDQSGLLPLGGGSLYVGGIMNKDQYMALSDSGNYSPNCVKYERSTNRKESRSDSITLTGTGCSVRVQDDALELKHGRTHVPQDEFIHRLYRGT